MSAAVGEFDLDSLMRLPLPLAQLVRRGRNAPDARARHNNSFFLFEATIKLAASVLVAGYARSLVAGETRNASLDEPLSKLQKPSLGHWVGILRELSRHFGRRADAPSHPLGHFAGQLEEPRRDRAGLLNLYRRIKNGPDAKPSGDRSCSLLALFDSLTTYRNTVMGHGAERCDTFYEQEMGPLLLPAAADMLAEGVLDFLGPPGSRLAYLGEVRKLDDDRFEVGVRELLGAGSMRVEPLSLLAAQAQRISPNRLAVMWRGHPLPLRLDPLLVYREATLNEEVRFLNSDRGKQVEYLSYMSGETERDSTTVADLERLLELVCGHAPRIEPEAAVAAAPPVERDFEILAEIGRGGMGVIYLARQISLGRLVALKMLPADLSGDEVALARFNREIRALGQCDDPHIVKVLTSGKFPDGQRYYAMEYVPGADLDVVWQALADHDRQSNASNVGSTTWSQAVQTACRHKRTETLQRASSLTSFGRTAEPTVGGSALSAIPSTALGEAAAHSPEAGALLAHLAPLPELPVAYEVAEDYARRVAMLIRDAARALQTVHDQGIVHRDVKPANLMLTPDGTRVVLMDFGLAKGDTRTIEASRMAGLLGTLRYAAPEQLAAAQIKVGPKADVRGLGVTLFELLTRHRLFDDAADEKQLTSWVLTKPVPRLRTIDPALDPDLEAIVAAATELSQDDRLSARNLADLLDLYLAGMPLPIRLPGMPEMLRRWIRDHKGLVGAISAAVAAIVIGVITAFTLINAAKNEALVAEEKAVKLAADKTKLAAEKTNLAAANLELANKESAARQQVQAQAAELQRQLARSLFERGFAEYVQGHVPEAMAILARAYQTAEPNDRLRTSIRNMLGHWLATGPVWLPHLEAINSVAFSPDGTTALTGSQDATAHLWSARTGKPLGAVMNHDWPVNVVVFNHAGTKALTGDGDPIDGTNGGAHLWDARTGVALGSLDHKAPVAAIAISPDDATLLTGYRPLGGDGPAAYLWPVTGGKIGLAAGEELVNLLAFSPDGTLVATGSRKKLARLWNAKTGQPVGEPMAHEDGVNAMAFSPDGSRLLTASSDKMARLWDAHTGKPLTDALRHDGPVVTAVFSPDGALVVTGSSDRTARLWDARSGKSVATPLHHSDPVRLVAFSPDGTRLATGAGSNVRLWDVRSAQPLGVALASSGALCDLTFSADGERLLAAGNDGWARVWRTTPGDLVGKRMVHRDPMAKPQGWGWVDSAIFSPDGSALLTTALTDKVARLWDARTGTPIGQPLVHEDGINAALFSRDGQRIVTASQDLTAHLWDARTGKPLGDPMKHDKGSYGYGVDSASFSPDGNTIVTGGDDSSVRFWDGHTGKPIGEPLRFGKNELTYALYSPDGLTLFAGCSGHAQFFDPATRRPKTGVVQNVPFTSLRYNPDGSNVLSHVGTGETIQRQGYAHVVDARKGRLAATIETFGKIDVAEYSPNGAMIVTGGGPQEGGSALARLWDAHTGQSIGAPMVHGSKVEAAAFSPDNSVVLTGTYSGAQFWDVASCKPLGPPIHIGISAYTLAFSPDGSTVAIGGYLDKLPVCQVYRVPRPISDRLVPLVVATHGCMRLSDADRLERLSDDELRKAWRRLETDGSDWLTAESELDTDRRLQWHRNQAGDAESREDWFAAEFHLRFLLKSEPKDPDFQKRYEHAKQSLAAARAAQPMASPPAPNPVKAP